MTNARDNERNEAAAWRRVAVVIVGFTAAVLALATLFYSSFYQARAGDAQPIPFSHRFHAGTKEISCLVCHPGAADSSRASVPSLETCMLCHSRIAVTYPYIAQLRNDYYSDTPVVWRREFQLPDFVYFEHWAHVRNGVDCSVCHGDVKGMDRVQWPIDVNMGFCIQCHRDNNVSHDCWVCHR